MTKRYWWSVFLPLAALGLGLTGGLYLGYKYARGEESLLTAGRIAMAATFATNQYLEADYPEAKEALLHCIQVLEAVQADPFLLPEKMLLVDLGLTHGRLALLEETAGKSEAAATAMAAALEHLRQAEWKDPTEDKLRRILEPDERGEAEQTHPPTSASNPLPELRLGGPD